MPQGTNLSSECDIGACDYASLQRCCCSCSRGRLATLKRRLTLFFLLVLVSACVAPALPQVKSIAAMQSLMRYNNYEHDPLSHGNPMWAISSRGDLQVSSTLPLFASRICYAYSHTVAPAAGTHATEAYSCCLWRLRLQDHLGNRCAWSPSFSCRTTTRDHGCARHRRANTRTAAAL